MHLDELVYVPTDKGNNSLIDAENDNRLREPGTHSY